MPFNYSSEHIEKEMAASSYSIKWTVPIFGTFPGTHMEPEIYISILDLCARERHNFGALKHAILANMTIFLCHEES